MLSELQNFASVLLINRVLLSKYSRSIFYAFIAIFIVKFVQSIKKCVYFWISKLFFVENGLFHRYMRMNAETKGIG